ncbi:hypothetical protein C0Q70_13392 [Pomacea canaliculata]|uniref:Uncharacterized protein n=1 Tax=Pomacea canaliculata TaxID=400727 RepID=A0A2T7NX47_POMCA|nr:hypothetical protein C0Q70_13392 [Pomacea canaliculata]
MADDPEEEMSEELKNREEPRPARAMRENAPSRDPPTSSPPSSLQPHQRQRQGKQPASRQCRCHGNR